MGWCEGSYIANDIWKLVKDFVPENQRQQIARAIVDRFEDEDADCWDYDMNIVVDGDMRSVWAKRYGK